jgi:2-hydroxy-6-oxonona-2,4-dienedioate hydrolase
MTQGFITVDGARLWYEESGASSGHAVTFVHAGICDHRQWDSQMAAFGERYRVIRFDLRGHGQSELPAGPVSLSDDLAGLLDALGVERSAVIGCSMGGSTAIDFALKQPARVAALVAVCSAVSGATPEIGPGEEAIIAELEAADASGDDARLNAAEVHLFVDGAKRTPEQVAPGVRTLVAEMNLNNIKRSGEWQQAQPAPLSPPAIGRLGEIHTPTLVVVGGDDTFSVRKLADTLTAEIAGARKVVMAGLTHVPNMERPDEFNQAVLDFLKPIW